MQILITCSSERFLPGSKENTEQKKASEPTPTYRLQLYLFCVPMYTGEALSALLEIIIVT